MVCGARHPLASVTCELETGHEGPHEAHLARDSRLLWNDSPDPRSL